MSRMVIAMIVWALGALGSATMAEERVFTPPYAEAYAWSDPPPTRAQMNAETGVGVATAVGPPNGQQVSACGVRIVVAVGGTGVAGGAIGENVRLHGSIGNRCAAWLHQGLTVREFDADGLEVWSCESTIYTNTSIGYVEFDETLSAYFEGSEVLWVAGHTYEITCWVSCFAQSGSTPESGSAVDCHVEVRSLSVLSGPPYAFTLDKPRAHRLYAGRGSAYREYPFYMPFAYPLIFSDHVYAVGIRSGSWVPSAGFAFAGATCSTDEPDFDTYFTCDLYPTRSAFGPLYGGGFICQQSTAVAADQRNVYFLRIGGANPCWVAGTPITMADGSQQAIETVAVGDAVLGYDLRAGTVRTATVTRVYQHAPAEMGDYYLLINGNLGVTPNHLLYVNAGLTLADDIRPGDVLTESGGGFVPVTTVTRVYAPVETYNFDITTDSGDCDPYFAYVAHGIVAYPLKSNIAPWVSDALYARSSIANLGLLPGADDSRACDVNEAGQVAGYGTTNLGFETRAFRWENGVTTELAPLPTYSGAAALGIAAGGEAVGLSGALSVFPPASRATLWSNGAPVDLGALGGAHSAANAINSLLCVVGWAETPAVEPAWPYWPIRHAYVWQAGPGMTDLGTLGGAHSEALNINESGWVVGWANTSDGQRHGFAVIPEDGAWFRDEDGDGRNDLMIDLGVGEARDISASGVVGGSCAVAGTTYLQAARWEPQSGGRAATFEAHTVAPAGTLESRVLGVNAHGQLVGWARSSGGAQYAFLYNGCRTIDVNALLPAGAAWQLTQALAISDEGRIVGAGTHTGSRGFLLRPAAAADYDLDGDVDGADFDIWRTCFSGPQTVSTGGCDDVRLDEDEDVDVADFTELQRQFTGPYPP